MILILYLLTALQGIVWGEGLFRLVLLASGRVANLKEVFSNQHGQAVVAVVVILLTNLAAFLALSACSCYLYEVLAYAIFWTVCRHWLNFPVDMNSILTENNAHLGPGLALNYWDSLLKPVLKEGVPAKMRHFMRDLREKLAGLGYRGSLEDLGFLSCSRLILLLPDTCHLSLRHTSSLEAEGVYRLQAFDPQLADDKKFYDLLFPTESPGRPPNITLTVHWIYAEEGDEQHHAIYTKTDKTLVKKILFIHDFPLLLQSAMAPGRGWDEGAGPRFRAENLSKFVETLRGLLEPPQYRNFRQDLVYCRYSGVGTGNLNRPSLSSILRAQIREAENQS